MQNQSYLRKSFIAKGPGRCEYAQAGLQCMVIHTCVRWAYCARSQIYYYSEYEK